MSSRQTNPLVPLDAVASPTNRTFSIASAGGVPAVSPKGEFVFTSEDILTHYFRPSSNDSHSSNASQLESNDAQGSGSEVGEAPANVSELAYAQGGDSESGEGGGRNSESGEGGGRNSDHELGDSSSVHALSDSNDDHRLSDPSNDHHLGDSSLDRDDSDDEEIDWTTLPRKKLIEKFCHLLVKSIPIIDEVSPGVTAAIAQTVALGTLQNRILGRRRLPASLFDIVTEIQDRREATDDEVWVTHNMPEPHTNSEYQPDSTTANPTLLPSPELSLGLGDTLQPPHLSTTTSFDGSTMPEPSTDLQDAPTSRSNPMDTTLLSPEPALDSGDTLQPALRSDASLAEEFARRERGPNALSAQKESRRAMPLRRAAEPVGHGSLLFDTGIGAVRLPRSPGPAGGSAVEALAPSGGNEVGNEVGNVGQDPGASTYQLPAFQSAHFSWVFNMPEQAQIMDRDHGVQVWAPERDFITVTLLSLHAARRLVDDPNIVSEIYPIDKNRAIVVVAHNRQDWNTVSSLINIEILAKPQLGPLVLVHPPHRIVPWVRSLIYSLLRSRGFDALVWVAILWLVLAGARKLGLAIFRGIRTSRGWVKDLDIGEFLRRTSENIAPALQGIARGTYKLLALARVTIVNWLDDLSWTYLPAERNIRALSMPDISRSM
ncbi:hypothetical protein DFP72DRAFT_850338 [Ephemerocybe angulata]|uniref:Uncharacterized protein n=1 Tax=Ephemerocybe angulata TaxID=980116 RepID=A0A8H6HRF9_9AGAR|nr:hypothetical protein DFP72DRAFT_850338 [Tulosesus angulatus]